MTTDEGGGVGVGVGVGENYEIRVKGRLGGRWAAWFEGMGLCHEDAGIAVIHGPAADQAALHGLLSKVRDLGLPLMSVTRVTKSRKEQEP
jgi:hypothetical protein